jgi:hypothetical protein
LVRGTCSEGAVTKYAKDCPELLGRPLYSSTLEVAFSEIELPVIHLLGDQAERNAQGTRVCRNSVAVKRSILLLPWSSQFFRGQPDLHELDATLPKLSFGKIQITQNIQHTGVLALHEREKGLNPLV